MISPSSLSSSASTISSDNHTSKGPYTDNVLHWMWNWSCLTKEKTKAIYTMFLIIFKNHLHGLKQLEKINMQRLMHKSVQRPLLWFKLSTSMFSSIHIWFKVKSTLWDHDRTIGRALLGQTKPTTTEIKATIKQILNSVHVNITHFHWVKKPERNHTKLHIGIQRETELQPTVSNKYRIKNKSNTIIIIILQSTTKLKYITGNGCYHIWLQSLAAWLKKKVVEFLSFSFFFSCVMCSPTSDVQTAYTSNVI